MVTYTTKTLMLSLCLALVGMNRAYAVDINFQEHLIITDNWAWFSQQAYASDIDGDGNLDAVSCSRLNGGPVWWFENSGGSSPSFTAHLMDRNLDCRAIFAVDVDGEGDEDVLSASALEASRCAGMRMMELHC